MKYKTGISIDIFPYDYTPIDKSAHEEINKLSPLYLAMKDWEAPALRKELNKILRRPSQFPLYWQILVCMLCRKGAYSHVGKYTEQNTFNRIAFHLASLIPGKFYAMILEKYARKYNNKQKYGDKYVYRVRQFGYVLSLRLEPWTGYNVQLCKELFDIKFEGHYFLATKHLNKWLKASYNDYMKLLPADNFGLNLKAYDIFDMDAYTREMTPAILNKVHLTKKLLSPLAAQAQTT